MTDPSEATLAERLWTAKTPADAAWLIDYASEHFGPIESAPVGGRPNNSGIIRVSSDPMLALVERITNSIDACLDLNAFLVGGDVANPREGARKWFKVPDAGLVAMSDAERRTLAQNIVVVMEDSGELKRPSISITDKGSGIHPTDFADTILSLNASNKVQAAYTMGTFGQGGSATLGFAKSTVIVSRCHSSMLRGRPDRVGWTVATEYFDEALMKVPSYVFYRQVGADGVFDLDAALFPDLEHGTRVIHVAYDAQRGATAYTTGAWQILNATLFDPVLPFILGGNRRGVDPEWKADRLPTRVITGTATRLSGEDVGGAQIELAHSDSHVIDLGPEYGSVRVAYWSLRRPEDSASSSEITRSYVESSSAVSITLYGQRQDATPRTWIKDRIGLPFLYKNMVVQIDADRLTGQAKRELFSSTRERATESDLRRRIYDEVGDILRNDSMLRFLNTQERERLLRKSSDATNEKIRQRLAKFIKTKLQGSQRQGRGGTGDGSGGRPVGPVGPPSPPRDLSDGHLPNVPTSLSFERSSATVRQGSKTSVWVLLNAKNGYLPAHDDDLSFTWPRGNSDAAVRVITRSTLGGGKSSWQIAALPNAAIGECALHVELVTSNGILQADLELTVVAPDPAPKDKPGIEPETGPEVRWVVQDDWEDHDFTDRSVGRVDVDTDSTLIFINRDYRLLAQSLSGRLLSADQIATRADRYQYPVACALWLQSHEVQKLEEGSRPSEAYLNLELERLAEAVLLASDPDVNLAQEGLGDTAEPGYVS